MRGGWAHEPAPRPHEVAHARTWRLRTVGVWGVACLHQGGACDMRSATAHAGSGPPAHHAAHHPLWCSRPHCTPQIGTWRRCWLPETPHGPPKLQILGPLGAFGAAPTRTGGIRTAKTQRYGAYGPMGSSQGHMRRHARVHGALDTPGPGGRHSSRGLPCGPLCTATGPPARRGCPYFQKTFALSAHFRRHFQENMGHFQDRPPESFLSSW